MGSQPEEKSAQPGCDGGHAADGPDISHQRPADSPDSGWHATFNRLLGSGHIFMAQTYTQTGMLFRGMPSELAAVVRTGGFLGTVRMTTRCVNWNVNWR
ncbi:MAG: hypothetical protein U5P41_16190 [Gammaproteobacteria bacterium]|nr:hypothetical protein [Gammaproteobacteria bacterium]